MEKLLEKISNYLLLNAIVPGFFFVYLSKTLLGVEFLTDNLLYDALLVFGFGVIISRVGSSVIKPVFLKIGLIEETEYEKFVKAEKKDEKISEMSAENNMFRSMIAACFVLLLEKLYLFLKWKFQIIENFESLMLPILLALIFILAHRDRTKYIVNRIKIILPKSDKDT